MSLSRHSVEIFQETSSHATCQGTLGQLSQLTEPLWSDPDTKSWIKCVQANLHFKQQQQQKHTQK